MCEIIECPAHYRPSHEAAVFDLDNANSDMEFWGAEFAREPFKHAADRYQAARKRFSLAVDIAWEARYREVATALVERGKI